jgi:hypothetical protein
MRLPLYVPGSISLSLLLPLCLWWRSAQLNEQDLRSLSLVFPTEEGYPVSFSPDGITYERYPPRLYHCIGSVSAPGMDRDVRSAIHDLVLRKDREHGLYLTMSASSTYGEVMAAVDHCLHVDTVAFAIYPQGIWMWYAYP